MGKSVQYSSNQRLKFAVVGAHHQNGHAERRIRELQDLARTMLIHANKRWPTTVTTNLWPYAIRMVNSVLNNTPSMQDKQRRSPMQIFANTKVAINPKHWHPFGCPVYVLSSKLQNNTIFHKWKQRADVGIYIGTSPIHNKNVALVLSRQTGLVSPQFHVKFDDRFQTIKDIHKESLWQTKAGFMSKTQTEPVAPTEQPSHLSTTITTNSEGGKILEGVSLPPTNAFTMLPGANNSASQQDASKTTALEGGEAPIISKRKQISASEGDTPQRKTVQTKYKYNKNHRDGSQDATRPKQGNIPHISSKEKETTTKVTPPKITRSGRTSQPTTRFIEAMISEISIDTTKPKQGNLPHISLKG